jgi:hypothetical protein
MVPATPPPNTRRRNEPVDILMNTIIDELIQDNKKRGEFQLEELDKKKLCSRRRRQE